MEGVDTAFAVAWWLAAIAISAGVVREVWVDADARVLLPGVTALVIYALHQATDWSTWLQIAGLLTAAALGTCGGRLLCYAVPPLEGWLWPLWVLWHGIVDSWLLVLAVAFSAHKNWDAADPRDASRTVWGAWAGAGVALVTWSIVWHVRRRRESSHDYSSV